MLSPIKIAKEIRTQLVLLCILALALPLSRVGVLPTVKEIEHTLGLLFQNYGVVAVGLISFIENIAGLNVYFPGSIVILVAMSMTAGNPISAVITFSSIVISSFLAHSMNFYIGYRVGARRRSVGHGAKQETTPIKARLNLWWWLFSTLWHPHTAAVTCIAAGNEGISYSRFIRVFVVVHLIWNAFWGVTMYSYGHLLSRQTNLVALVYVYICVWAGWDVYKLSRFQRLEEMKHDTMV